VSAFLFVFGLVYIRDGDTCWEIPIGLRYLAHSFARLFICGGRRGCVLSMYKFLLFGTVCGWPGGS